jgi:hypothetical protein
VTAVPRFKASYPDRVVPKFNGLAIDKRFRPPLGLLHAVTKQVYPANDMAIIPQDVDFVLRHLQPPSAPEMQEECHFGVIENGPTLKRGADVRPALCASEDGTTC